MDRSPANGISLRFWTERSEEGMDIRLARRTGWGTWGSSALTLGRGDLADLPGVDAEAARQLEETLPELERLVADEDDRHALVDGVLPAKVERSRMCLG